MRSRASLRRETRCIECGRKFSAEQHQDRICETCRTCHYCGVLPGNASILGWTCQGCFSMAYRLHSAPMFAMRA